MTMNEVFNFVADITIIAACVYLILSLRGHNRDSE